MNGSFAYWCWRNDRISAIKQYEALRTMLLTEFGMEPKGSSQEIAEYKLTLSSKRSIQSHLQ